MRSPHLGPGAKLLIAGNLAAAWAVTTVLLVGGTGPAADRVPAPRHAGAQNIPTTCPGPSCPYTPPSALDDGIATDVLARINLERSAPQRDYSFQGTETALPPLALAAGTAEETAQAAAEWQAVHDTVADYLGTDPAGYAYVTGGNASAAGDSAGVDDAIMHSYGHALGILSAAPTEVAVGAACSSRGTLYVTENFYDPDQASATNGQARLAAELAENNVYTQSGGTVTTVTDASGSGPAQDSLPQQPIVAGYGADLSQLYVTGADWTCEGVRYPPGSAPAVPLPAPVKAIVDTPDGGGYVLADAQGAVAVHGDAAFHGDLTGVTLASPVTALGRTPDGGGYWMVGADGGVFAFGDAGYHGSLPGLSVHTDDVVGIAPTPDGGGYWMVGADGGVFALGLPFYGAD